MITTTILAMSTGALVAIIIGTFLPLFVIFIVFHNKKKKGP